MKKISIIGILSLFSVIGMGIGYYFFKNNFLKPNESNDHIEYVCPMHSNVVSKKPGKCPICHMSLEKISSEPENSKEADLKMLLKSTNKFIIGNYTTTFLTDTAISSYITIPGIVGYDLNSSISISARVDGRIEKMFVKYKFQRINKGQKLFDIYSPELLTEQRNYLYLLQNDPVNKEIIAAARQKLLLLGLTENQINELNASSKPIISIYSPTGGIVVDFKDRTGKDENMTSNLTNNQLAINEGSYIQKNTTIFSLIKTEKVWGIFNILPSQNTFFTIGTPLAIKSEIENSPIIYAKVDFIETQLKADEKTNRIRVYLPNKSTALPIGARLSASLKVKALKKHYIKRESVISIGKQKIVFQRQGNGFKAIPIETGISVNNYVQVLSGLTPQTEIAENAQFLIDSESFIKINK